MLNHCQRGLAHCPGKQFIRGPTRHISSDLPVDLKLRTSSMDGQLSIHSVKPTWPLPIAVGLHGTPKLVMRPDSTGSRIGVLDDSGQKYLSNLTTHGNSGGDLELANASGQIVAFMDANPSDKEGRAVFANLSSRPERSEVEGSAFRPSAFPNSSWGNCSHAIVETPLSVPKQTCHPDRSVAKWRDLRFAPPAFPNSPWGNCSHAIVETPLSVSRQNSHRGAFSRSRRCLHEEVTGQPTYCGNSG
jgi:hypothetical protein